MIDSCDNCCACCMEMNTPPGSTAALYNPGAWPEEDVELIRTAPPEAIQLIVARVRSGAADEPCCWLDVENKRCRFYEHRPSICREFEIGSSECEGWRELYQIT